MILSGLAAIFNLVGLWLLPRRKYWAIYAYTLSSICFLIWSIGEQAWSVAALQVCLLALNVRTYLIWRKDEHHER